MSQVFDVLLDNPFAIFEDRQEDHVPTATLQMYQGIADSLGREGDTNTNRASSATMCVRRRWYQAHGYKGTPLTPRKLVNFLLGDLSERVLVHFIKEHLVGPGRLYAEVDFGETLGAISFQNKELFLYKQKTMSFTLENSQRITAHADGFGKRNSDGKWELIEIKSAADYGFDRFKDEGPGDYIKQAHAVMLTDECQALDIEQTRYFYLRKNTGNLWDKVVDFDWRIAKEVKQDFLAAMADIIPPRPHLLQAETFRKKPTGRVVAGFPCSYCPYLAECQGDHTKEFKNGSPKFVFTQEEAKELSDAI